MHFIACIITPDPLLLFETLTEFAIVMLFLLILHNLKANFVFFVCE